MLSEPVYGRLSLTLRDSVAVVYRPPTNPLTATITVPGDRWVLPSETSSPTSVALKHAVAQVKVATGELVPGGTVLLTVAVPGGLPVTVPLTERTLLMVTARVVADAPFSAIVAPRMPTVASRVSWVTTPMAPKITLL